LLFLVLPSKFYVKFSKYDATIFLQVYSCSLFNSMSTVYPTLSNVYFCIIAVQKFQDSFTPSFIHVYFVIGK